MIVDDDDASARVAAEAARMEGFETRCFPNGAAAMAAREDLEAAAVFLIDLHMPDVDGLRLARTIRAVRSTGLTVVAILTADARFMLNHENRIEIDRVLHKPVDVTALRAFLQTCGTPERKRRQA